MTRRLERKAAIDTVAEAIEWLGRNPVLLAAFVVAGVLDAFADAVPKVGVPAAVAFVFAAGLAFRYALAEVDGRPTTFLTATRAILPKLLSLLGALILYVLVVGVGFLALVLPGIYVALRLSLAFPAIVIDDRRAVDALETSWAVAHGNLFKLLGIALAVGIVAGLLEFAVSLTGAPDAAIAALELVVTAGATAVVLLAYARVYLENRPDDEASMADVEPWGADSTRRSTSENRADEVWTESPRSDGDEHAWRDDRSRRDDSNQWR